MLKISQLLPPGQRPKSKEIFYWFVEAQKDPDTAPLVFWTNGGPGCSGLAGFLTENGPFRVGFDGKNLVHNSHAWNKIANMIFVEQPAGVGFSSAGENPKYSDENSANDNQHFIMKWYERYPALKTHDFYLSSESYGGHYLPTLAKVLVEKGLMGQAGQANWTIWVWPSTGSIQRVITAGGHAPANWNHVYKIGARSVRAMSTQSTCTYLYCMPPAQNHANIFNVCTWLKRWYPIVRNFLLLIQSHGNCWGGTLLWDFSIFFIFFIFFYFFKYFLFYFFLLFFFIFQLFFILFFYFFYFLFFQFYFFPDFSK